MEARNRRCANGLQMYPAIRVSTRLLRTSIVPLALFIGACSNHGDNVASSAALSTSPVPAASKCGIYAQIFPVSRAAFDAQHLTSAKRKEVEIWSAPASPSQMRLVKSRSPWAAPPTAAQRHLLRWMRVPGSDSLLVFIAWPVIRGTSGYYPWITLNANEFINPITCQIDPYPTA